MDKDLLSVQEVRDLIKQAKEAQKALAAMDQGQIDRIAEAVSRAGAEHARRLAEMAVEETGFGIVEHKEIKNRFSSVTVYEAIKDLKTIGVLAEDKEHKTVDIGVPVGIVYIGLATPEGTFCRKMDSGRRRRDRIQGLAANHAFDIMRRYLTGMEI